MLRIPHLQQNQRDHITILRNFGLAADPDYVPAKLFLVALHLDAARFDPALEVLSSIRSSGSTLLARYLRASVLFAQADANLSVDLRSAMQALEASLGSDGRFADGHVLLARYYRVTDAAEASSTFSARGAKFLAGPRDSVSAASEAR
jgi:predicted Zn-dependent protease